MADTRITIDAQIQMRHDTEANWMAADPVLRVGEPAYTIGMPDRFKIGDGQRKWSELPYLTMLEEDPEGPALPALGELADVEIEQPVEGQALVYDEVRGMWVNRAVSAPDDEPESGLVFEFVYDSATNKATAEMVAALAEAIAADKLILCNGRTYKFILELDGMYGLVSDTYLDIMDGKLKASVLAVVASSYDVQLMEQEVPAGTEITEATISGWGFTKNAGTITGIKMNGATKGISGVVDLGNVLTEHQKLKTINGHSVRGEGDITIVGAKGDAGVTSAEVSVDNKSGLPSATATVDNQVLKINFSGLKGEQGNSGFTGAAGELEVVNNLTQGGATAALSAEMGKQIGEVLYGMTESNDGEDEGGNEGADGEVVTLTSADFVQGSIDAAGGFTYSATRIRTEKYPVVVGDKWTIVAASTQRWAYELYGSDGKGTYNSGWITTDQTIEIVADGFIAFVICKTNGGSIVPSELLVQISYTVSSEPSEPSGPSEPSEPSASKGLIADVEELKDKIANNKVVEIINNLTDGGEDKALSAEMGKQIGEVLYGIPESYEYTLTSKDFVQGSIDAAGGFTYIATRIRTDKIAVEIGDQWQVAANGQQWFYYLYSESGSMVSGSGWLRTDETIAIESKGYIAFGVAFTNDGAITPSDLLSAFKCNSVTPIPAKKGLVENVDDLLNHAGTVQKDIYGVPSELAYTQDDIKAADYLTAQGKRGYFQWNIADYPSWELAVNVPSSSSIKSAIQGSATAAYGNQIDDSGWINPGKSKTYSSTAANGSVKYARLVFTDYATSSTIPTIEDILANGITFSFKAVAQSGGLIVRMDALESKIAMPSGGIVYNGEKVALSEHGFTYKMIGSLAAGSDSRQGSALWGKYFFQFHNALGSIVVYDLEAKKNVQTLTLTPNSNHHAGSGGFGNEFYDASDEFPLLYISSMYEMKVYVYRITGAVGAWSITLVQTIAIALDVLKIPNITIDRESNKIVFFGYTKASWNTAAGNQSVITSCDIPLLSEGDVTISEFYNVSRLPFIYAQQGAFARFGKLYLSYGNTISSGGAFVIDYKGGVTLTSIDFAPMGNFEPEGFEKYGDKVIMTDQSGNIYELSF